eukprot:6701189-Prymnesium_polylepis.1
MRLRHTSGAKRSRLSSPYFPNDREKADMHDTITRLKGEMLDRERSIRSLREELEARPSMVLFHKTAAEAGSFKDLYADEKRKTELLELQLNQMEKEERVRHRANEARKRALAAEEASARLQSLVTSLETERNKQSLVIQRLDERLRQMKLT